MAKTKHGPQPDDRHSAFEKDVIKYSILYNIDHFVHLQEITIEEKEIVLFT